MPATGGGSGQSAPAERPREGVDGMRRRISTAFLALVASLALAAPVLADTVPGPGNFRDSGTSDYFYAFAGECGQSTCTEFNVYAQIVNLQSGDTFASVCLDRSTYPIRGGRGSYESGCVEAAPNIASDLSSASFSGTIPLESCNRRVCTVEEVDLSVSLSAVAAPNSYSYTQKNTFENCTDTYRVRGDVADAEGSISVDGTSLSAFGQIGSETFAFSSRCR
jgi:hypothetical protein